MFSVRAPPKDVSKIDSELPSTLKNSSAYQKFVFYFLGSTVRSTAAVFVGTQAVFGAFTNKLPRCCTPATMTSPQSRCYSFSVRQTQVSERGVWSIDEAQIGEGVVHAYESDIS